jgi:hypothetical protein
MAFSRTNQLAETARRNARDLLHLQQVVTSIQLSQVAHLIGSRAATSRMDVTRGLVAEYPLIHPHGAERHA